MHKKVLILIFGIVLFYGHVVGKELDIGAVFSIPPYIISEPISGMEVDIVNEALMLQGHTIKVSFLPSSRIYESVAEKKLDAGMTAVESEVNSNLFFSDSHITYQNVAIALKDRNYDITDISKLSNYSLVSFQNAARYLGNEYNKVVSSHKKYSEKTDQTVPVAMLFSGRVDTIVMDINIFNAMKNKVTMVNTDKEVQIFEIFPKNNMKVVFNDRDLRDKFNQGLADLRNSGRYDEIIKKYTSK